MTLVERCRSLEARIAWSKELEARRHAAEQLGVRTERIELTRRSVQAAMDRAEALRDAGRQVELPPCHGAIAACNDAAAGIRGDVGAATPEATLEDASWKRTTQAIEDDAAALATCVRVAIDDAQTTVRLLDPAKFRATAAAQRKDAEFAKWTELRTSLLAPPAWYTRNALELRQLLKRVDEFVKGADALDFAGAPEDARQFLELARKGDATIADLTPKIQHWLVEKGLLANLRITFGGR